MSDREAYYDAIHDRQDRRWKERPMNRDERLASIKRNAWRALVANPADFHAEDKVWLVEQLEQMEVEREEILAEIVKMRRRVAGRPTAKA
jgi:hypothetical protein